MDQETTRKTTPDRRPHLCLALALAVVLTVLGATSARAESSRVVPLVVEPGGPCVEVGEGAIECDLETPAPEPEKTVEGKDGTGLGGATTVPGGGPKHQGKPAEAKPTTPGEAEAGEGTAEEAEAGEGAEEAEAGEGGKKPSATKEGETAPLHHAETLASPAATEAKEESEDGGTVAGSPRLLKELGPLPESGSPPAGPAAPSTIGGPLPGGLGGASTMPLGQIELPPLLLPVYQACGTAYDVPWQVLAAINKIESGFGANMGPSSAGAVGPMQFMPATWAADGLDANGDGAANAWDPFDAICAAARYLHTAGAPADLHGAIFAYNHADWYVEEILREARNFEALPENLLASMTALAEGETTPAPQASGYRELVGPTSASIPDWVGVPTAFAAEPTAEAEAEGAGGPAAEVDAPAGSPVTAVAEGTVIARGHSAELGNYLTMRDPYGARYTYSDLGPLRPKVKKPTTGKKPPAPTKTGGRPRLYAHPPARGGDLIALRKGTEVRPGTVLARVGDQGHFDFALQPDGSAPIAPLQFLQAWKRGGAGGIYLPAARAKGDHGRAAAPHPATLLVAGEAALRGRALHGHLLELRPCLRERIAAGGIAPRALAGAEFLAAQADTKVAISTAACHGDDRFRLELTAADVAAPVLAEAARGMQGAMGPQRVHAALAAAEIVDSASHPKASAAVARIASTPAGAAAADGGAKEAPAAEPTLEDALELDFLPPQSAELKGEDAVAPIGAPAAVQAMIAAADQINETPYIWGGGHGDWVSAGYDCSGSVSYVLHAAGLLGTPLTSGSLESFGAPGPGRWVTIYANAEHVYAEIAGLRWDTVGDAQGSGPRWHLEPPYPEGFVVRHPVGL
jgi:cell wall-associated NlpC family hydrolase